MVEAGGRLYVTLGRGDALIEIEPRAGAILRVLPLAGEPHGLAVWGENLVVTLDAEHALVVLDRATLTEIRRYQTGDTPHVVAISSDSILVTDSRDDVLRQVVPRERTVSTGTQPEGIAIAGGFVATADAESGTLTVANATDLSDVATVKVGPGPVRVASVSGTRVVVSLRGEDRVAVVDLAKQTVERRIATGERPDGLCVSQAGDYFGSAANGNGALSIYSTEDWKSVLRLNLNVGLGSCLWMDFR
jgi:DNA-binding beta-propeller fold protein YncE